MQQFQIRTDLALEATESVRKQASGQMRGISIDEYDVLDDVHISKVVIMSRNAAKSMGKPMAHTSRWRRRLSRRATRTITGRFPRSWQDSSRAFCRISTGRRRRYS